MPSTGRNLPLSMTPTLFFALRFIHDPSWLPTSKKSSLNHLVGYTCKVDVTQGPNVCITKRHTHTYTYICMCVHYHAQPLLHLVMSCDLCQTMSNFWWSGRILIFYQYCTMFKECKLMLRTRSIYHFRANINLEIFNVVGW